MSTIGHILICDDQYIIHETIIAYLKADGFAYDSAYDGEEALKKAYEVVDNSIVAIESMFKKRKEEGLSVSTFVTLLLIPVIYSLFEQRKEKQAAYLADVAAFY